MTNKINFKTMKTKFTLLIALLFLGINASFSQNEECLTKMSLMTEAAKIKNYDAAYPYLMELRKDCPKYNKGIYVYGEDVLEDKIEKSNGAEKVAFINDLLKLWEERAMHFASKTKKGEYDAKACQLKYDYKTELALNDAQLYKCFDDAFKGDRENFKNPKSILTYFKLMVSLYDAGQKPASDLFDKYDDLVEKIDEEVEESSVSLNKLIAKEDAGTALTKKDGQYKRYYESVLKAFDAISGSLDAELGERANCENLIPLYEKGFEDNKSNAVWLQRAAGRMSAKDCTDDPLFFKLVNAYHNLSPSANSAYYLGILKEKEGKSSEAVKYYEQAISLEGDEFKKAKLYTKIAYKLEKSGNYGKARIYYSNALASNPSNGNPHMAIARMYANSAKNCGDTAFNKRAVYWLAEQEAYKAGRVDPTLKSKSSQAAASYKANAPQKSDIFAEGNAGKTINIGCWIGRSVTVPSL